MTVYVVCDVEFDGPIPGPHSMISLGAVAINKLGENLGEFEINFLPLENSNPNEENMNWFNNFAPEALEYTKKNQVNPKEGMIKFGNWLLDLPNPRVFAAHPAHSDYMWVNWYIKKFLKDKLEKHNREKPFFDEVLDIKTFATALLKKDITNIGRDTYPKDLHNNINHTHKAIDDAREYSQLLIKLFNKAYN